MTPFRDTHRPDHQPASVDAPRLAADLFHLKQYGDAADAARAGLDLDPDNGRLWQVLGAALWHLGDVPAARSALETAAAIIPLKPLGQRLLAECYVAAGKRKLAIFMFRHLVRGGQCPSELLPAIAASLNKLGQYKLALQACRTLTRRHPHHHQAHFATAFYLNRLGANPRLMIGPLNRAMDAAPHLLHYRINLAFAWAEAGEIAAAANLLAPLHADDICCPAWLRRMHAILHAAGDDALADACSRQLDRLEDRCSPD